MKFGTLTDPETLRETVLLRVDFNSPIDPISGIILDDKRFREHVPTVKALSDSKCVILTHQSRPGKKDFTTLEIHAGKLERLLGRPVQYVDDIFGRCAREAVNSLDYGEVLMLENVRFNAEENLKVSPGDAKSTHIVKNLSQMGDLYVNDAFGTAHRSQPTIVGLPLAMRSVAGLLMEKEVTTLSRVFTDTPGPVTFVLGGTKVDDSLDVARNVLDAGIADRVIVVGVVANIFLMAEGIDVGTSSTDLIKGLGYLGEVDRARSIMKNHPGKVILPETVAVREYEESRGGEGGAGAGAGAGREEYSVDKIPKDCPVLDLGLDSIAAFSNILKDSGTVVLNGPAGVFEDELFATGTFELLKAASRAEFSIVGGGHTATVIKTLGLERNFTHISTGGGACIEFLTGKTLPAIAALEESKRLFW